MSAPARRDVRGSTAGTALALVLTTGAVAVVLGATPFTAFDLDRHAVPKELTLHLTALVAGTVAWLTRGRAPITLARPDQYLAAYLALGALSALLATNHWLGLRALAISASGITCWWCARRAAALGGRAIVLGGLAIAFSLAAATGLLQAYGITLPIFAETRAPGGTFGNRNFLAHVAAIGLPVLVTVVLGTANRAGALAGTVGVAAATAILFLSRSRAAWLGSVAGLGMLVLWALLGARPALTRELRGRAVRLATAMTLAIALALLLPNALRWNDRNPYAATAGDLLDARTGSGRGRLIQWRNTLGLVARHPVLGVGPGNWAVRYPQVTTPGDPAFVPGATVPTNPWPSSDWVALLSERGVPALLLLGFAMVGVLLRAWRAARGGAAETARLAAWGASGTAAALVTVGTFDAVLLNAAPSLLGLTALGAMVPVEDPPARRQPVPTWAAAALGVLLVAAAGRSVMQLLALAQYDRARTLQQQTHAASLDPGNYRMQWAIGQAWLTRGRPAQGCPFARRAAALFPFTEAAVRLERRCAREARR